jgi:hypothetical protein
MEDVEGARERREPPQILSANVAARDKPPFLRVLPLSDHEDSPERWLAASSRRCVELGARRGGAASDAWSNSGDGGVITSVLSSEDETEWRALASSCRSIDIRLSVPPGLSARRPARYRAPSFGGGVGGIVSDDERGAGPGGSASSCTSKSENVGSAAARGGDAVGVLSSRGARMLSALTVASDSVRPCDASRACAPYERSSTSAGSVAAFACQLVGAFGVARELRLEQRRIREEGAQVLAREGEVRVRHRARGHSRERRRRRTRLVIV